MQYVKIVSILMAAMMFLFSSCKKEKVDMLVINAQIYTVDSAFNKAEAFAVKDGKFVAVGSNRQIQGCYKSDQIIDAQGGYIYPGFMDGHSHFSSLGETMTRYADLNACRSMEEVIQKLREHADKYPSEWLLGRGWDQNLWSDKNFPTNELLNKYFPNQKVALTRVDGHAGLVSDVVLKEMNFGAHTVVEGGKILLDDQGKPTGLVMDNAYDLIRNIITPQTYAERVQSLLVAQNACFSVGLSAVTDAGVGRETVELMDSLQTCGKLKMKINAMLNSEEATLQYFLPRGVMTKERLSVRSVKLYADGALGSRGAFLLEPYQDDLLNCGLQVSPDAYYLDICKRANESGFQVCTHAIGDAGVDLILHIYSKILLGPNDKRWRIEHAQVVAPQDFVLFKQYNVIPAIQSTHATSDMRWAKDRLGNRIVNAYAYQKLLQQNGWLINGTDFPIENINPLYTFYAAIARKDLQGYPEDGFQMENALTREEALRSITIWVARGYFEETRKGSIEPGKEADFVMLDQDIMTIEERKIPKTQVKMLSVSGEIEFQK